MLCPKLGLVACLGRLEARQIHGPQLCLFIIPRNIRDRIIRRLSAVKVRHGGIHRVFEGREIHGVRHGFVRCTRGGWQGCCTRHALPVLRHLVRKRGRRCFWNRRRHDGGNRDRSRGGSRGHSRHFVALVGMRFGSVHGSHRTLILRLTTLSELVPRSKGLQKC